MSSHEIESEDISSSNQNLYTPKKLASILKVSPETLRLWSLSGKLQTVITKGGHRRYIYKHVQNDDIRKGAIYARVSSNRGANDIPTQVEILHKKYPQYDIYSDIGSGVSLSRKGLLSLIENVLRGTIKEIVIADKSRLSMLGFDFIEMLCTKHNTTIIVDEDDRLKKTYLEDDLQENIMAVVSCYVEKHKM